MMADSPRNHHTQIIVLISVVMLVLSIASTPKTDVDSHNDNPIESESYSLFPNPGQKDNLGGYSSSGSGFQENKGQLGPGAGEYYFQGTPYSLALGVGWIAYKIEGPTIHTPPVLLKILFIGCNPSIPEGQDSTGKKTSFFIGNEKDRWVSGVEEFSRVVYKDLWTGIDLIFKTTNSGVKYDFLLNPQANEKLIAMEVQGHTSLSIDGDGNLVYQTSAGKLIDGCLKAFYHENPESHIDCSFEIQKNRFISFNLEEHDRSRSVVIDPLVYSTFVGSDGGEMGWDLEIDDDGNVFIAGNTNTDDFPTTPGAMEPLSYQYKVAFVVKLDASGSDAIYAACIGGTHFNSVTSIDVDNEGCAYITGWTWSEDFPKTDGAFCTPHDYRDSMFITKLAADGKSLIYSCQISGNKNDHGNAIEVDKAGYAYVTGDTASDNFPVTPNASQDYHNYNVETFVLKLDTDGSKLIYSTYVTDDAAIIAQDIALDSEGNAYIAGKAGSTDTFPITEGAFQKRVINMGDWYALKLNANGSKVLRSTFIGGNGSEWASNIEVDRFGYIYVSGYSQSRDFPTTTGAFKEKISPDSKYEYVICKFDPNLTKLVYSTFIGQNPRYRYSGGMDIDAFGHAYITGSTTDSRFPTTENALKTELENEREAFICQISTQGDELLYSSFLGGGEGLAVIVDNGVNAYVTGRANVEDFPTTKGAYCETLAGGSDAFVLKIDLLNTVNNSLHISDGPFLYSGYDFYTFSVIQNPIGSTESPMAVRLTLNAGSDDVILKWEFSGSNTSFSKEKDPKNLVSLDLERCEDRFDPESEITYLDYYIMFSWSWPHENPCDVLIEFIWTHDIEILSIEEGAFSVENDLEFYGHTVAVGEVQGPLVDGDWIAPGEGITIKAPPVVYQGTESIYPPAGTVMIHVDDGQVQSLPIPNEQGNATEIYVKAPDSTDTANRYSLIVEELPGYAEFISEAGIGLPVDGESPFFRDAIPSPDDWHSESEVLVFIVADDGNLSGVDVNTLEYSYMTEGQTSYTNWNNDGLSSFKIGGTVEATLNLTLPDGDDNFIRWRVKDNVGNGYSYSDDLRLRVDTINVTFSYMMPSNWVTSISVTCAVTISDEDGAGIDVSTIQYRFSINNLSHYNHWINWTSEGLQDEIIVHASVEITFGESPFNMIQWRAMDIAGNGFTTSPHLQVKIDLTNISFSEFRPRESTYQNSTEVICWIRARDPGHSSGVNLASIEFRVYSKGPDATEGTWTEWLDAGMSGGPRDTEFSLIVDLVSGKDNMIQFKGWDIAGNGPTTSLEYRIQVDTTPPSLRGYDPPSDKRLWNRTVKIRVEVTDDVSGVENSTLQIRVGTGLPDGWDEWMDMQSMEEDGLIFGIQNIVLDEGNENAIQIRCFDNAGNLLITDKISFWVNRPPVAVIDFPKDGAEFYSSEPVVLSSKGSSDPDEDPLSFNWIISGPKEMQLDADGTIGELIEGEYIVSLTVLDEFGAEDSTSISIIVRELPGPSTPTREPIYLIWIVIILVLLLILAVIVVRMRRRDKA
jgi:hypothetical protein